MQAAAAKPGKKRKASDVAEAEPETAVEEDSEADLFSSPKAPPRAPNAGLDRVGRSTLERSDPIQRWVLPSNDAVVVYAETRVPVQT